MRPRSAAARPTRSMPRTRGLRRLVGGLAIALPLLLTGPAWGANTVADAVTGDGTSVGGTNIAELKDQIKRDRLSCAGAEAGAGALVALGVVGLFALRARRRTD